MKRLALLLLLAPACGGHSTACTGTPTIFEVEYDSPFYEVQVSLLEQARKSMTCTSQGAIRNAFGAAIGYRYACVRC